MHFPPCTWGTVALYLHLDTIADCLKVVYHPHYINFLVTYRTLPLWVPCIPIFAVSYQFLVTYIGSLLPTMTLFSPASPYHAKFFHIPNIILNCLLRYVLLISKLTSIPVHYLPHLYLSRLLIPLLFLLWWFHHLCHLWIYSFSSVIFFIFVVCDFNLQSAHPLLECQLMFSFRLTIL